MVNCIQDMPGGESITLIWARWITFSEGDIVHIFHTSIASRLFISLLWILTLTTANIKCTLLVIWCENEEKESELCCTFFASFHLSWDFLQLLLTYFIRRTNTAGAPHANPGIKVSRKIQKQRKFLCRFIL